MSQDRWQQIEDLFHRAVELAPESRAAFLDEACAADEALRVEVESLLIHDSTDDTTFEGPPPDEIPTFIAQRWFLQDYRNNWWRRHGSSLPRHRYQAESRSSY